MPVTLAHMPAGPRWEIFRAMSPKEQAAVLEGLPTALRWELLAMMTAAEKAAALGCTSAEVRAAVLAAMTPEEQAAVAAAEDAGEPPRPTVTRLSVSPERDPPWSRWKVCLWSGLGEAL